MPLLLSNNIITKLKLTFLTPFVIFLILILVLFLILPCVLIRWFISNFIKRLVRPDLSHILCAQGHCFITAGHTVESCIAHNIVVKFKIQGVLNMDNFKSLFLHKMLNAKKTKGNNNELLYPEFKQYCVSWAGYWFWKDEEEFNIDNHIKLYNIDARVAETETKPDWDEFSANYAIIPFETEKSPWEILVIDNSTAAVSQNQEEESQEAYFLVLLKFHHSLADGYAMFHAILQCSDVQPVQSLFLKRDSLHVNNGCCTAPVLKLFFTSLLSRISFPFLACVEIWKQLELYSNVKSPWEPLTSSSLSNQAIPEDPLSPTLARQRLLVKCSEPIPVAEIKAIATSTGVSFSSVLLTAAFGGLRNYLYDPINGRAGLTIKEIPEQMLWMIPEAPVQTHSIRLTNSTCHSTLKLPNTSLDTLERLKSVQQELAKKSSVERQLCWWFITVLGLFPKPIHNLFAVPKMFPPFVIMSNFPGPIEAVSFNGEKLYDMSYLMVSVPAALFITVISYAGELQFYCSCDHNIFGCKEEVKKLVLLIEKEFKLLSEAVIGGGSKVTSPLLGL